MFIEQYLLHHTQTHKEHARYKLHSVPAVVIFTNILYDWHSMSAGPRSIYTFESYHQVWEYCCVNC